MLEIKINIRVINFVTYLHIKTFNLSICGVTDIISKIWNFFKHVDRTFMLIWEPIVNQVTTPAKLLMI